MDVKYFKVLFGYGLEQYAQITEEELPKAYAMFLTGEGKSIFSDGTAIRAMDIIRIEPDWHREFGWNKGYKLVVADFMAIREREYRYKKLQNQVKELVEHQIRLRNVDILSLPLSELKTRFPELNSKNEVKKLKVGIKSTKQIIKNQ